MLLLSKHLNSSTLLIRSFRREMKSYIQILGTFTSDTTPSIVVHYDSQRYLFNCGEGTQRLLTEHKIRMGKMKNVFITHLDWRFIGGIPGMILTMAGSGLSGFNVNGPPNTTHFLGSLRHFTARPDFPVGSFEFGVEGNEYRDENVVITAVPIRRDDDNRVIGEEHLGCVRKNKKIIKEMFASHEELRSPKIQKCEDENGSFASFVREGPEINIDELPKTYPDDSALCYIIQAHDLKGKFDAKKAQELKIPNGRIRAQLVIGLPITLEDGKVIQPSDVIGPSIPGKIIIILHLPSKHYLNSLYNSEAVKNILEGNNSVSSIVHILDDESLLLDSGYCNWVKKFGPKVEHIMLSKNTNRDIPMFTSAANQQNALHGLNKKLFPLYYHETKEEFQSKIEKIRQDAGFDFECGKLLLRYDVEPKSFLNHEEAEPAEAKFRHFANRTPEMIPLKSESNCRISFLGTGSMLPSKYRNGAAILDVGEGSYGQLARLYGPNVKEALKQLRFIFVSHMHADHHLGLLRIILEWEKATYGTGQKLHILCPKIMPRFLNDYSQCQDLPFNRLKIYDCRDTLFDSKKPQKLNEVFNALGVDGVNTFRVDHCQYSYGVTISNISKEDPFSITYSGDTRPCKGIVNCTKNLRQNGFDGHSVLIHEATFNDDMKSDASKRKHSTLSEAIGIGKEMGVNEVILTHFSQRYPKLHSEVKNHRQMDVGFACDGMVVDIKKVKEISKLQQKIQTLYHDSDDDDIVTL